jgi:Thioesterase-like superfamily
MTNHGFDRAIALVPGEHGQWQGQTDADYGNFIGPFGGITAAQLVNAVMLHPLRLGDPVSLTVNYAATLAEGKFSIDARPARTNRSTQHWIVEILQGEETAITATVVTAVRRETWCTTEHEMPQVPRASDIAREVGAARVAWFDRYDLRFVRGGFPAVLDGRLGDDSLSQMWIRNDPPRALDFPALAALCDTFFPRLVRRRATMTSFGTVSMTVYFHAGPQLLAQTGGEHVFAQARGQNFRAGFFDQTAQLWNAAGDLLATSHQLVYYKE